MEDRKVIGDDKEWMASCMPNAEKRCVTNAVQVKLAGSDGSQDVRVEDNFDNKMIRKVIAS